MNLTPLFLAQRILSETAYKKNISTMTFICFSGIFIGTFALALITAIMNGFEVTMHQKMQGIHAHIIMQSSGNDIDMQELKNIFNNEFPAIQSFSPLATHHLLLRLPHNGTETIPSVVIIRGIDPQAEQQTSSLAEKIIHPKPSSHEFSQLFKGDSIIIGKQLAINNGITVNDSVELLYIEDESLQGRKVNLSSYKARVSAIFNTGIDEFDNGIVYCSFSFLEKLFPNVMIEHINIALKPHSDEDHIIQSLRDRTGLDVYSWRNLYPALIATLKLEKYVSFFIIALILLVASMNIISLLFMQITQKRSTIALLKAMGMSNASINAIFFIIGFAISCTASVCGLITAGVASLLLNHYPFITLPDTYYVTTLPVTMTWHILGAVFCTVMFLSFIAIWISVKQIYTINSSQVLRFEG